MRRVILWIITALLTFTIGVVTTAFWLSHNHSSVTEEFTITSSALSSQAVTPQADQKIYLRWIYINKDMKWESPPKEIVREFHYDYKYSQDGHLMVFYPDGRFASVGCMIYRDNKSHWMRFVPNEGFAVNKGVWRRNDDDTITVTSRLASSNKIAVPIGHDMYEEHVEQLKIRTKADDRLAKDIMLDGRVFIPSPSVEGLEQLLSMPNDIQ